MTTVKNNISNQLSQTAQEIIEKLFEKRDPSQQHACRYIWQMWQHQRSIKLFSMLLSAKGHCILECNDKRVWNKLQWIYGCPMFQIAYRLGC